MQDAKKICETYANSIYKYLLCLTHNQEIAEELTQDTFYNALKNLKNFRHECPIEMWLLKIARNLWFKRAQKLQEYKNYYNENIDLESIAQLIDVEELVIKQEEIKYIQQEIRKLNAMTIEVINLRIYGNLSFKEIGNLLGKSEVWARVTFYRGKEQIKGSLGKEFNYEGN